jgi:hypothetical protein
VQFNNIKLYIDLESQPDAAKLHIKNKSFSLKSNNELPDFVALLKTLIPASDRVWNPTIKCWLVSPHSFAVAKDLLTSSLLIDYQFVPDISTVTNLNQAQPKATTFTTSDFFYNTTPVKTVESKESLQQKLAALLQIPISILTDPIAAKRAYRTTALKLHPDRNNGDGSKMSELNLLWSLWNA